MKLFMTPKSHFSRKVRLLLDHLELSYDMIDVGNVATDDPDNFGGNPLMGVPVLEDGTEWLVDSDNISSYLSRTYDPEDRFAVLTSSVDLLNARAVMNGVMGNEVKLILSKRTGLDPGPHAYFQKAAHAIELGLGWLEARSALFQPESPGYAEFHLVSMWDHLESFFSKDLNFPSLREISATLAENELIQLSRPS